MALEYRTSLSIKRNAACKLAQLQLLTAKLDNASLLANEEEFGRDLYLMLKGPPTTRVLSLVSCHAIAIARKMISELTTTLNGSVSYLRNGEARPETTTLINWEPQIAGESTRLPGLL